VKILVAIKPVPNPDERVRIAPDGKSILREGVKTVVNPFCEIAVEEALRIRERTGTGEVVVVTAGGRESEQQLRFALAMGADRGILLEASGELDGLGTAKLLRTAVEAEAPGLVLLGKQAVDDDNNQVGQILAALLSWPQATFASRLELLDGGTRARVDRETDAGLETIEVPLPAVVTTDLRLNEPRYASLPGIMKARKKDVRFVDAAALGVDTAAKVRILSLSAPGARAGGRRVADAAELVRLLREEAKVLG
jgi:electron transfer flavoprotein beta subunit